MVDEETPPPEQSAECPTCDGDGWVEGEYENGEECPSCGGFGWLYTFELTGDQE